jgi:hypothetical protein
MKLLQEFLEEEKVQTMHFEPVKNKHKRFIYRYSVMIELRTGANEWFFRTRVNAKNKNDAIEQASVLMHDNAKRMQSVGIKVISRQAELVHKEEFKGS